MVNTYRFQPNPDKWIQWGCNGVAIALSLLALGSRVQGDKGARVAFLLGALPVACFGSWHGCLADKRLPYLRIDEQASIEAYASVKASEIESGQALPPPNIAAETPQNLYDWQNAPDDAVGVIICGNSGQGKSSIALWLLGLFTQQSPAIIKVLDPHKNINHWHEHNLEVIGDFAEIESELLEAVKELDRRRELPKTKLNLLPSFIYVADELGAMSKSFSNPKVVGTALSRLGCEGRKYNLSLIVVSHSKNVDKLGIDSNERDNYLVICLGGSARQIAERTWGKKSPEYQQIHSTAYPCVVSGSVPEIVAIHPTHGHHTRFKKNGNTPLGLLPIQKINVNNNLSERDSNLSKNLSLPTPNEWVDYLNKMYESPPANSETSPENLSDSPENRNNSETDETTSGQIVSPFPKPDHDPADGCVRGGSFSRNEISLERACLVLKLKKEGKNKTEIILAVWEAKPGGNKLYIQAKTEFEAIKAHWQSLNLWE